MSRVSTEDLPWAEWVRVTDDGGLVGPGTLYPVGLDEVKLARWLFLVKAWEIGVDLSGVSVVANGGGGRTASVAGDDFAWRTEQDYDNESHLLARPWISSNTPVGTVDVIDSDGAQPGNYAFARISFTASITNTVDPSGPFIYIYDGLYYPALRIMAEAYQYGLAQTAGGDYEEKSQVVTWESNYQDDPTPPTPEDFIIDGETVKMAVYASGLDVDTVGTGATVTAFDWGPLTLLLDAKEFWPYDPGDGGGPVWDSSDGSKLRSNYI